MCCLFGMIDYGNNFTGRQRTRLLSILAAECEARGTDASGIAYNANGGIHVYIVRFRLTDCGSAYPLILRPLWGIPV